jgi:redox-sensitive bicupin YhaK (pirin superfamily)
MIQVIRSDRRHHEDMGWLSTYWHFSFDSYYDPANVNWGPLRVFNDDVIRPGQGFGMHPHRDMEIITYVIEGALEHRDNQGNQGVIPAGGVQVMSAGTGIVHSEYNHSRSDPVHLLQLWILPRTRSLPPRWEQRQFSAAGRTGKLLPVVSAGTMPGTLPIDQDAAVYLAALAAGDRIVHNARPQRKAYLFVIKGGLLLNETALAQGDQARIADEPELRFHSPENSEIIFLDLPDGTGLPGRRSPAPRPGIPPDTGSN